MTITNIYTEEKLTATKDVILDIKVSMTTSMNTEIEAHNYGSALTNAQWIDSICREFGEREDAVVSVKDAKREYEFFMFHKDDDPRETEMINAIKTEYDGKVISDGDYNWLVSCAEVERIEFNGFSGQDSSLDWFTCFFADGTDMDFYQKGCEDDDI